jgi:hypothetical protein
LDICLFALAGANHTNDYIPAYSFFLGAIIAGSDLIYLIIIPMMIAKNYSAQNSNEY